MFTLFQRNYYTSIFISLYTTLIFNKACTQTHTRKQIIIINTNQVKKQFVKSLETHNTTTRYNSVYSLPISDWHMVGYTEQARLVPGAVIKLKKYVIIKTLSNRYQNIRSQGH